VWYVACGVWRVCTHILLSQDIEKGPDNDFIDDDLDAPLPDFGGGDEGFDAGADLGGDKEEFVAADFGQEAGGFDQQGFDVYDEDGVGGAFAGDPAFADPDLGDRISAFKDLIYWKDLKLTGMVFAGINVFFFLTYWLQYTVLYLGSSLLFYAICGSGLCHLCAYAYRTATQKELLDGVQGYMKLDMDTVSSPMRVEVNPTLAGVIEGGLNLFLKTMQEAILMKNLRLTLVTLICSYFVAKLSLVMDAFTMVYASLMMVFTLPKVWEIGMGNPQVHEKVVLMQQQVRSVWTVINDKVISHIPNGDQGSSGTGFSSNSSATDLRQRRGN
jgi:hypothetical protein